MSLLLSPPGLRTHTGVIGHDMVCAEKLDAAHFVSVSVLAGMCSTFRKPFSPSHLELT